jgi:hypothetical protein
MMEAKDPILYEGTFHTRQYSSGVARTSDYYREVSRQKGIVGDYDQHHYPPSLCRSQMKRLFGATSELIAFKVSLEEFPGSKAVRVRDGAWTTSKRGRIEGGLSFATMELLESMMNEREIPLSEIVTIYVKVDNLEEP